MTLKQELRSYEGIRREHDTQIIKIGLESGLHFSPDQWSHILYGDNLHKSLMQSILGNVFNYCKTTSNIYVTTAM